ncbi:MAG TPA: methyltransferase domain-containing protein, partial [Actinomycetota bacterium]|nr:methyltransferase domain-containing protein [Actinomycetota bacterium]
GVHRPVAVAEPALDPKTANARYHDAAAETYDRKWAITFDDRALRYVGERAERMVPRRRFDRVLEVGAGTGYLILNLWRAGYVGSAHATDISAGMLGVLEHNARRVGCAVETRVADAERLPYPDGSFDLVAAHAVLHHLPEPAAAVAEWHRVLRPGGWLFVAGEPTRMGDRLAGVAKAAARNGWRLAASLPGLEGLRPGRPPAPPTEREAILRDLEWHVDLHTFDPAEVVRWARDAGFDRVRVETEELLASLLGWAVRTIEAEARPGLLGPRWARAAHLGWRGLSAVDRLLYGLVPKAGFYNLLLSARRSA